MKRGRPWYVLLLALYPVLFLYARNLHFVFISDFLISEAVALACLGVLWGGAWLMVRDWQRAALLAAFWILFLQCYQPVYSVAWKVDFLWWLASRGLILWLVAMAAGTVLLLRVKMVAPLLVKCLNLAAIILVAFPAFAVVRSEIRLHMAAPKPARVSATEARPEGLEGRDLPDIYHIVLDAYGREDVLKDIYGYDNSPFLDELRNLGFFVASNARSNYWKTDLSMPSVFNMSYLTYVDGEEGVLQTDSGLRGDSNLLIRKGRVLTFLEGLGYRTVAFSVGYPSVELRTADVYFDIRGKGLADLPTFQYQALLMTPLPAALDLLAPQVSRHSYVTRRNQIMNTFRHIGDLSDRDMPLFVYAHVEVPHPPFVFLADGTPVNPDRPFDGNDGNNFFEAGGTRAEYLKGYVQQVRFANRHVLAAISRILERSSRPVVIFIQGDHGPGLDWDWIHPEKTNFYERLSILYALRLPGGERCDIPQDTTPVNLYRYLFSRLFGADLKPLPNKSYYATPPPDAETVEIPAERLAPR